MRHILLAGASLCTAAALVSSCYWLADYGDLSSAFGDAGSNADAGAIPEAGAPLNGNGPFCHAEAGAAYCMDFDGIDASALGLQVFGANAAIVDGPYASPPSALSVGLQGASSFGRYAVSFPVQPTTTRLEFAIQTTGLDEGVTTLAIALLEPATQTVRTLNVVVLPNGGFQVQEYFAFADGGSQISAHASVQLDAGALPGWHHVVVALTADDANKRYLSALSVDDEVVESDQPLVLSWAGGSVSLHLGVTFAAAGGPQFYFDNIRADFGM